MPKNAKETYIERTLEKVLTKYLRKKEIIALVGPRQCGKTTLLRHIFKNLNNAVFIDFEDRELLNLFEHDIKAFAKLYVEGKDVLFIDEFQYSKEGGKHLKYLYDHYSTKIVISGSSVSELSLQGIQYLVGRVFVFSLYPFSFSEFLKHHDEKMHSLLATEKKISSEVSEKIRTLYKEFSVYGGYPRVVLSDTFAEKELVLKNIVNTYLLKEIKEILRLSDDYKLMKLMQALALQIGAITNYQELSSLTGYTYHDLIKSLHILQKTFVTVENKPFYTNKRTELTKSPKWYFIDNGFRNSLLNNFDPLERRTDLGMLNENFIATELIKRGLSLLYWRTKSKAEIDFIIQHKNALFPLEVKSYLGKQSIPKSLYSFIEKYHPLKVIIVSSHLFSKTNIEKTKIEFIPHWYIERYLIQEGFSA